MEGHHCTVVRCKVADNSVTVAIRYPTGTRSNTGEVYYKGTDSDNIKIIASMPAYSFTGNAYNTVTRVKTNTDDEYLREAHTTIARMEIATIASGW